MVVGLGVRAVHLAVANVPAGVHDKQLIQAHIHAVTQRILVRRHRLQRHQQNLQVLMRMHRKAASWRDPVLVKHAQCAEVSAIDTLVGTEAEAVLAFEPAGLDMAALGSPANVAGTHTFAPCLTVGVVCWINQKPMPISAAAGSSCNGRRSSNTNTPAISAVSVMT